MLIIPAIDIKNGKCVRLYKGDFEQVKEYSENPAEIARMFQDEGAELIHIVDLDGARSGKPVNTETIQKIRKAVNIEIELGGGIRTLETIKEMLGLGIDRIILGTKIIENMEFLKELRLFSRSIVAGVDLRDECLSARGWTGETKLHYSSFIPQLLENGINESIITDISKDGTMEGPNFELYEKISDEFADLQIIVSGGISKLDDIKRIKMMQRPNIKGIITGKAIYEKSIDLKEAIAYAR